MPVACMTREETGLGPGPSSNRSGTFIRPPTRARAPRESVHSRRPAPEPAADADRRRCSRQDRAPLSIPARRIRSSPAAPVWPFASAAARGRRAAPRCTAFSRSQTHFGHDRSDGENAADGAEAEIRIEDGPGAGKHRKGRRRDVDKLREQRRVGARLLHADDIRVLGETRDASRRENATPVAPGKLYSNTGIGDASATAV